MSTQQITIGFLQAQVDRLNRLTGNPMEPYVIQGDKYVAQIGNYHLSGAYESIPNSGRMSLTFGTACGMRIAQRIQTPNRGDCLTEKLIKL